MEDAVQHRINKAGISLVLYQPVNNSTLKPVTLRRLEQKKQLHWGACPDAQLCVSNFINGFHSFFLAAGTVCCLFGSDLGYHSKNINWNLARSTKVPKKLVMNLIIQSPRACNPICSSLSTRATLQCSHRQRARCKVEPPPYYLAANYNEQLVSKGALGKLRYTACNNLLHAINKYLEQSRATGMYS